MMTRLGIIAMNMTNPEPFFIPDENFQATVIGPLVTAAATAVLGALAVTFHDWRKRRNRADRIRSAVSDATDYVGFIDRWIQVQERISAELAQRAAQEWATSELERARSSLVATLIANPPLPPRKRGAIRTALLLYGMRTTGARVARTAFHVVALLACMWIFVFFSLPWQDMGYEAIGVLVFWVIPPLLLRIFAVSLDERMMESSGSSSR